jgi:hypothetical protein
MAFAVRTGTGALRHWRARLGYLHHATFANDSRPPRAATELGRLPSLTRTLAAGRTSRHGKSTGTPRQGDGNLWRLRVFSDGKFTLAKDSRPRSPVAFCVRSRGRWPRRMRGGAWDQVSECGRLNSRRSRSCQHLAWRVNQETGFLALIHGLASRVNRASYYATAT